MSDFWDDRPDHLTPQIEADFGTDGFYERYAEAQELVTNRHSKGALVSLVAYLLKSEAQLAEAKRLLAECAADLASHADHEYPEPSRSTYPSMKRRYERDMELVYRVRTTLAKLEKEDD